MASSNVNPDNKKIAEIASNIADFPSKIPGKLVSAKRANTGKLNLHLVSSTPMNPAKKAKFFDESNQFGSPIKSGGTSSEVNTNSPDNKIKIQESETNKAMLNNNEEPAPSASPFPYYTNLEVKKMTICASDDDSEESIFGKGFKKRNKTTNDLLNKSDDDLSSETSDSETVVKKIKKIKAIIEPVRKASTDKETYKETENITEIQKEKVVDAKTNKNVLKTNKTIKSNEENKENVNIKSNEMKTKQKSQPVEEKNTKKKQTDINKDKPVLDISTKQKKSNENTVQKKKLITNKNENEDINNREATNKISNKKLTVTNNDTKLKTADKTREIPESVRKSSRSCQSNIPYWMAPFNTNINMTENEIKRTKSEEIGNSVMSVKGTKRPRTVPETVTKKKEPTIVKTKLESTVVLNRTKTKPKSEPEKKYIKKGAIEENAKNLNKSKTKLKSESENQNPKKESTEDNVKNTTLTRSKTKLQPESDKRNIKNKLVEENVTNIKLNRSKNKSNVNTSRNEKKSTINDEVPETAKKDAEKKEKEIKKNVLKSIEKDTELKETASNNVQPNKKRQYSKEILDKENKEKKNKVENIAAKLKTVSPSKSNLKDSVHESIVEDEVFEPEIDEMDNEPATLVNEDIYIKNKNNSKIDVNELTEVPFEVLESPRVSKRIIEKIKKRSNKFNYTPGLALKQNKNDIKSTQKRKVTYIENKINNKSRTLRPRTMSTQKSNTYLDEIEENDVESDQSNSESSNDNRVSQPIRKRRMTEIKPVKKIKKTTITTPGLDRKRAQKILRQSKASKSSRQVNFNINDSEMDNTFESDSLSPYENPSCQASYNFKTNRPRQFSRPRDLRYSRKALFLNPDFSNGRSRYRKNRYSSQDDTEESWSSEELYVPKLKKRKYIMKSDRHRKTKMDYSPYLNFKEKAINAQVPVQTRSLTKIQHHGKSMMMECFGNFPKIMTKINEQSSLRGTCFMNDWFAAGVMEITLGTVKKCNASNNHTYFVILDGIAEIGIGDTQKIMRIGDCCVVPKHTFYYIANASYEVNLLLNFFKVSL